MADDIVTRLRECVVGDPDEYTWWQTMTQAADEIERLRAERPTADTFTMRDHVEDLMLERAALLERVRRLEAERDDLRKQLDQAHSRD